MKRTADTRAARALLAYFNHEMVKSLVDRVLKEAQPEAKKRFAGAVLDMVPQAMKTVLWNLVLKRVEVEGENYANSPGFVAEVQRQIKLNADHWLKTAFDTVITERMKGVVGATMKQYDLAHYIKEIPGRFKAETEREIGRLAIEAARKASA